MDKFKVKLDKIDLKILTELDINCRVPLTKLSKKVGKSRQSVEYRVNQLVKHGVITQFNASINFHRMGLKIYKLFIKLKNIPEKVNGLLNFLRKSPEVGWLGEADGAWDIIFSCFFRTDYEFYLFKNSIISDYSQIILDYYGTVHIDVRQYPKMYFANKILPPVMFGGDIIDNKIDRLDLTILKALANNARMSINEIARISKSTPIIIRRRLKKLEEKGIVVQYRINVNLPKLGLEHYKTIIYLDRYTKEDMNKLFYYSNTIPNIIYLIRDMWRIELEFVTISYNEYNEIISNLKKEFSDIIKNVESLHLKTDEWTTGFENLGVK